jgi:hypothetical protein
MSEILAFLDRVIDELQPDAADATSREKMAEILNTSRYTRSRNRHGNS